MRPFLLLLLAMAPVHAQWGGELRFCLRSDPKTFDPVLVADDYSEAVRYLTGGVLIRVNRQTQQLEAELAESWKVLDGGRRITFQLRKGVTFSDGTAFTAEDVAFTIRRLMDPAIVSPTGDAFRSGTGAVRAEVVAADRVSIVFPAAVAGLDRLFDQMAVMSAKSPKKESAVLGPFQVAEYKPGSYVQLKRNPNYWKRDKSGRRLPYLDAVRLDIQQNRETEFLRFEKGEIHLINQLEPEMFDRLENRASAVDAGPSLEQEMLWFNQVPDAPIPAHVRAWFRSANFRRALWAAIQRDDICRIAYMGHARPSAGPFPPANRFWFHPGLKPYGYDPEAALRRLTQDGFKLKDGRLTDAGGNAVEFSVITNSGNKTRARIAAMVQQDLAKIGVRLNVVSLDFPSLIERISKTFQYEACLLGLVNIDLDPNGQMNVWLSSASNHQWHPNQKQPATLWEAEIDKLMRAQASTLDLKKRKEYMDRAQEIIWNEAPFIYISNRNALGAVSPAVRNASPVALRPPIYWNIERLYLAGK
jgi:peptide/nickel transport system substrate-binding protein